MAVIKVVDDRTYTHGGGIVRTELWQDDVTRAIMKYSFTYANGAICAVDDGRVLGFDNSHGYPGHASIHHVHWMGGVRENVGPGDPHRIQERFDRALKCIKAHYKRSY